MYQYLCLLFFATCQIINPHRIEIQQKQDISAYQYCETSQVDNCWTDEITGQVLCDNEFNIISLFEGLEVDTYDTEGYTDNCWIDEITGNRVCEYNPLYDWILTLQGE